MKKTAPEIAPVTARRPSDPPITAGVEEEVDADDVPFVLDMGVEVIVEEAVSEGEVAIVVVLVNAPTKED